MESDKDWRLELSCSPQFKIQFNIGAIHRTHSPLMAHFSYCKSSTFTCLLIFHLLRIYPHLSTYILNTIDMWKGESMISLYSVRYILITGNTFIKKVINVYASSAFFAIEKIKKELERRFSNPTKIEVYTV